MDLLSGLNPPQKEAVETTEGAVLVLAGAGSGKTRVLTYRIANIIDKKLARPEEVLAVTFTNKAANEMRERINALLGNAKHIEWSGTFHSMCVKILRREGKRIGINPSFSIYDSVDSLSAVKEAMNSQNISIKEFSPHAIRSAISSAKNELINSQNFAKYANSFFHEVTAKVYVQYQKILRDNQALDFDDLLMITNQLFDNDKEALEKYRERFKYINVDEYQDTNHAQYSIIKKLTNINICVVGDDDQSIYGFRGANVSNILNFEKDFPTAKIVKLEQNYRSSKTILEASNHIVSLNKNRHDKKMWTDNLNGEKIMVYLASDEDDEAHWIVKEIQKLADKNSQNFETIAILYRTNAQSRYLEEVLLKSKIPYRIVGSIRFYDRKEVKDILSYMRLIANPADDLSLKRIINVPRRGIGDKTLKDLVFAARSVDKSPMQVLVDDLGSIDNPKIKQFGQIMHDLVKESKLLSLSEFIRYLLDRSGYLKFLDDGTIESQGRIENIQELISVASKYEHMEQKAALEQFLEDIALIENQSDQQNNNSVTLMTVHSAKGLEYDSVFLVGMEEMLFPHSRSYSDPKEMEEERRLAYVAVTRAKKNLFLSYAQSRKYFGKMQNNPVSRFIEDIPEKLIEKIISPNVYGEDEESIWEEYVKDDSQENYNTIELEVGDKVKHQVFGVGKVSELNEYSIVIDFGLGKGKKELALEFARLEKLG
ncbi:UvrD-helicase domain-containing protein [Candidatus Dojkabacteria bacterium]|nr:UvrD-helicase domain-containing protein [Candidatus Dojkabacteria bacterium]